ncbi:hypothetical protein [Pseudobutyrivibrio sp. YE44]|uniref:hypothetical protein n=1 Tax=Pseudobutyrivibrio sp. YE44 TaxID=1520802 RepID=UPI00115FFF44|nr:hypothetical protein [Pseudobutyrivibrio sp. YE44]
MIYSDNQMMLLEQLTYLNDDVYKNIESQKSDNSSNTDIHDIRNDKTVKEIVESFSDSDLRILEAMGNKTIKNEDGDTTYMSGAEWAAIIKAIKADEDLMKLQISNTTSVKMNNGGYRRCSVFSWATAAFTAILGASTPAIAVGTLWIADRGME